jgi:hypothetical protein
MVTGEAEAAGVDVIRPEPSGGVSSAGGGICARYRALSNARLF